MCPDSSSERFDLIAEVPVEEVRGSGSGFTLAGRGADRRDYRLEVRFDVPVDARTRKVLGELLSEAEVRILRRAAS